MPVIQGVIDTNLQVPKSFVQDDLVFYNVRDEHFCMFGLLKDELSASFRRLPQNVAENTNEGVLFHSGNTSGGRVCFKTNSNKIALKVAFPRITPMPHMTFLGSMGFDLYEEKEGGFCFVKSFTPPIDVKDEYQSLIEFGEEKERTLLIHFPLYNDVSSVYVGVQNVAKVNAHNPYKQKLPIVFYGSSITQGGCASRPGNQYTAVLSRRLHMDFVNLGFSGSARGEDAIVDYMNTLPMSIFVSDYDHNAPSVEHLENTHLKMIAKIRNAHPDLPIVLVTKPDFDSNVEENTKRRAVVYATYMYFKDKKDQNIYFVDGQTLFGDKERDACTVDGCHPNDLGFYRMAEGMMGAFEQILSK